MAQGRATIWGRLAAVGLMISGIIVPQILGRMRDDYSPVQNYLSELGASGTSTQFATTYFAFWPTGLLCLLVIYFMWRVLPAAPRLRAGLICIALGIPAGYIGAAIFPCDYGCPLEGSVSQTVHNLLGLVQYPLGVVGLGLLSSLSVLPRLVRLGLGFAAAAMAVGFVMMLNPDMAQFRGAWQRLGDFSAFIALSYCMFRAHLARGE